MQKSFYLQRIIKNQILENLYKNKVIIIYGARQVGKTTLSKEIMATVKNSKYISCDELEVQEKLIPKSHEYLKSYFGDHELIVLDEAQNIENIGVILKIMVDFYPEMQIIATGSSSFDLANKIGEPLVGRSKEFLLYPVSMKEYDSEIDDRIIFGNYPDVLKNPDDKKDILVNITKGNLYKDILAYRGIKKPLIVVNLLKLLAHQIGNEVSYKELADILKVDKETVENYINLLEQAFIIFKLSPFSRNKRDDIKKLKKIYFWDTGIRNTLIEDWTALDKRGDKGFLLENFFIAEKLKNKSNGKEFFDYYFWREKSGAEIDYIEFWTNTKDIKAFECKYKEQVVEMPWSWERDYPTTDFNVIDLKNIKKYI